MGGQRENDRVFLVRVDDARPGPQVPATARHVSAPRGPLCPECYTRPVSASAQMPVTPERALVAALLFLPACEILYFSAQSAAETRAATRLANRSGSDLFHA